MRGKFLKGIVLGGVVGAAIASKWDMIVQKCPFIEEVKGNLLFDEDGQPTTRSQAHSGSQRTRTRLMARRHRIKKEPCL